MAGVGAARPLIPGTTRMNPNPSTSMWPTRFTEGRRRCRPNTLSAERVRLRIRPKALLGCLIPSLQRLDQQPEQLGALQPALHQQVLGVRVSAATVGS